MRNGNGQIIGVLYVGVQQSRLEFLRDKVADVRVGDPPGGTRGDSHYRDRWRSAH